MAARKKRAAKRRSSAAPKKTAAGVRRSATPAQAIAVGRALAVEALAERETHRRRRAAALKRLATRPQAAAAPLPVPPRVRALLGDNVSAGTLIAEGDSWFDYPLNDVLSKLEDEHAYDVESVAHRGDRVEDMAFGEGQFADFSRRLEKVLRAGTVPKAILLSGGGNDIAGSEFGMLLNHARSPHPGFSDDIVRGVIDERIRVSYTSLIAGITTVAQGILGRAIPIIIHGYARPVPDGRGFAGGWGPLPGPWLRPGFEEKGFGDQDANTQAIGGLIDHFNDMLVSMAAAFPHVHYVDLRGLFSNDSATYKQTWANELHPQKKVFGLIADEFNATIEQL